MEKAKKLAMAYQVTGVPTMVVNGKYRFDIGSAGGPEETLKLADYLIEKSAQRPRSRQGDSACCAAGSVNLGSQVAATRE